MPHYSDGMRILLAEDDPALGQALVEGLRQCVYAVDWITDGAQASAALADTTYAAAVLDWSPPRSSGPAIIAGMRRRQDAAPVLLLTARDALSDRVAGLDAGADDYVVKPVHLDELAARLRALLRRADGQLEPSVRVGMLEVTPAAHFLQKCARELGRPTPRLSAEALRRPENYAWPGNVRELENLIERAVVLCHGNEIGPAHFPAEVAQETSATVPSVPDVATDISGAISLPMKPRVETLERQLIAAALARAEGNKAAAARMLEISERALWYKIKRYEL